MSDPAKTPEEIEDVLASVRRLVSDHVAPRENAPQPVAAEAPAPDQGDALVLTPSFRVTDPEDPWVPVTTSEEEVAASDASDADVEAPEVDTASERTPEAEDLVAEILTADLSADLTDAAQPGDADWQPDDRLASFDAVGEGDEAPSAPQEWVDDHGDVASDADIADLIRLDGSEATPADFESETGDDNWPEGGAEAALLTLVARRDPGTEEEEVTPSDGDAPDADDAPEAVDAEDAALDDTALNDAEAEEMTDAPEDEADDVVSDEGAEEASSEEVAEDTAEDEPDISHAEPEGDAAVPIDDLGDTPSPFSFPEADEGILDEDTLREIIVEVVREELQGVLGQRITRNVRKMVRREIRLALAAEDLE